MIPANELPQDHGQRRARQDAISWTARVIADANAKHYNPDHILGEYARLDRLGVTPAELTEALDREYSKQSRALPERPKLELLRVEDLPSVPPPIIFNGLLRVGQVLLMGGHSKKWKSYALRDMFFCASNAIPWLIFEPGKRIGVADFDLECEGWDLRARYHEIRDSYGFGDFDFLRIVPLRGKSFSLSDLNSLPEQLKALDYLVGLFGLDPVYRLLTGPNSENNTGLVTEMMNKFLHLATEVSSGVALSHHFSKGGQDAKEAQDRFSGTGVWGRHPDALLTFTQHAKEDCFTVEAALRSFKRPEPFVVHWQYPRFIIDKDADPEDLKKPKSGRPKSSRLEDLCNFIPGDCTVSYTDLWTRAKRMLGISESTFKRRLKEGKDRHWVYRTPNEEYGVTETYLNQHPNTDD